uniref:SH3 domain-containing protein n=1 Tax=Strigamia maritima TaxID=126957 RepID=T1JI45_STRMM
MTCERQYTDPIIMKELAKVLYAYDACNDDELSLKEGDVITIITKEVEDKGWWKGELNNKIGVFPDNFVELLPCTDTKVNRKVDTCCDAPQPSVPDHPKKVVECCTKGDEKPLRPEKRVPPLPGKKPQLPPPLKKPQRGISPITETTTQTQPTSLLLSSSSPPSSTTTTSITSSSSSSNTKIDPMTDDMKVKSQTGKSDNTRTTSDELGLDSVELTTDKLTHLTASRPRNPHHRPPSHLFMKDPDICYDVHENKGKLECTVSPTKEVDRVVRPCNNSPQLSKKEPPQPIDKGIHWPCVKPCPDGDLSPPKMKQYSFSSKNTPVPKEEALNLVSSKASKSSEDSMSMMTEMKKELNALKTKVLELQLMTEMHRAQYQEKVKELTHEIDEEKKTRMMMQVELDRLKRQLRDH